MELSPSQVRELILKELPALLAGDPGLREQILSIASERFADRKQTEGRIETILAELRRDREENSRRWEENSRRWEENQREIRALVSSIENLAAQSERRFLQLEHRFDSTLGALGARWGLASEEAWRSGLATILGQSFGATVARVLEFDSEGRVFGRPDQVEIDVVVKNGELILVEIKSSMSRGDVYAFDRKVSYYEEKHGRKATRRLIISPMVEPKARVLADTLGIEVASYPPAA